MNQNVSCRLLCRGEKYLEKSYSKKQVQAFENFIKADYRVHWLMDNLPAATKVNTEGIDRYVRGYPIGFVDSSKVGRVRGGGEVADLTHPRVSSNFSGRPHFQPHYHCGENSHHA